MKQFVIFLFVLLSLYSCNESEGGNSYPDPEVLNTGYLSGYIIGRPIDYDAELGYQIPIDVDKDWFFGPNDQYVWIANSLYDRIKNMDSVQISAIHYHETHLVSSCNLYIVVKVDVKCLGNP